MSARTPTTGPAASFFSRCSSTRRVTDCFDVVTVGIAGECPEAILVKLGSHARLMQDFGALSDVLEERQYRATIEGHEGDV